MKKKFYLVFTINIVLLLPTYSILPEETFFDTFKRELPYTIQQGLQFSLLIMTMSASLMAFETLFKYFNRIRKQKEKKILFADIGGYQTIKDELLDIIREAKDRNNKETNMTCILLYGPPGTGKTYIAQALASQTNTPISILDPTDLTKPYMGEGEAAIKHAFETAKENTPYIVFIDEIDNILSIRKNGNGGAADSSINNIKNLFLTYMDGTHNMKGVILIGTTNNVSYMDPAFLRSGRFEYKIFIDLPNYKDRLEIINLYIKKNTLKLDPDIPLEYIAEKTDTLTPADINSIFKGMKRKLKNNKIKSITKDIFTQALNTIQLAKTSHDSKKPDSPKIDLHQLLKIFNV
jgi:SpoVK/Ycf46/Vps4 family AAA+-type ATPase